MENFLRIPRKYYLRAQAQPGTLAHMTSSQLHILCLIPGNRNDYTTCETIEGLYAHDCRLSVYAPESKENGNGVHEEDFITLEQVPILAAQVAWIFIFCQNPHFSHSPDTLEGSPLQLLDALNQWEKCVYIDGTEYSWDSKTRYFQPWSWPRFEPFNWNYMKQHCAFYFKRECYREDYLAGYLPYPFAFSPARKTVELPDVPKQTEIFCSFPQDWTGYRQACIQLCRYLQITGLKVNLDTNLSFPDFCKQIAGSYISLDACGGGQVNARFWELAAYGTVPFRQQYGVIIPYDFEHEGESDSVARGGTRGEGQMIVEYRDQEDLHNKLLEYLKDKPSLQAMGKRAQAHLFQYHTSPKRVGYLLGILQGKLRVEDCLTPATKRKFNL